MDNNMNPFNGGNGNGSGNGSQGPNGSGGSEQNNPRRTSLILLAIAAIVTLISMSLFMRMINNATNQEITYGKFQELVEDGKAAEVTWDDDTIYLKLQQTNQKTLFSAMPEVTYYTGKAQSDDALTAYLKEYKVASYGKDVPDSSGLILTMILTYVLPIVVMWLLLSLLFRRMGGGGPMGVGKSNAKVYVQKETGITFKDVAGEDEAKESRQEVVDFLHNPQRYVKIGAKLPKGALLVGPPGTGKTLLAKAVAGEAKVPFFSLTGSDFIELYVGVGASRVRDLFEQAKKNAPAIVFIDEIDLFKEATKNAPCIIFIDEIDAIGRSRDSKYGGGNEEREQTLNQLLSEMDGFDTSKGILVLGATNRPEILDKALLRPGRFDRRIPVELPDLAGREAILRVHAKDVKTEPNIDYTQIARATSGCSGAELANIINEAAIAAVKDNRKAVSQRDLEEAIETVIAGYQRKNAVVSPRDKLTVSYHECGHALVAAKLKNSAPVQKITIIPRTSGALGYTMQVDEEERLLMTREQILDKITTFCGGRAAEQLIFGRITSGASNDIEQATKLARAMITRLGMSDTFGMMALETQSGQYLSGDANLVCSDQTAARIDVEVKQIIANCYERAYQILEDNKEKLHETAKVLLEKETITGMEFMAILAPNQLPSAEGEKAEEKPEDKPADSSADDVEVK